MRSAAEAQHVIAMRLTSMSEGGPGAALEAHRMVSEKMLAFWAAQSMVGWSLLRGPEMAARNALLPYRRAIRANHRRLKRARRKAG
jgi:hypothetical protein